MIEYAARDSRDLNATNPTVPPTDERINHVFDVIHRFRVCLYIKRILITTETMYAAEDNVRQQRELHVTNFPTTHPVTSTHTSTH